LKFCQDGFFAASPGIKIPAQYMEAPPGLKTTSPKGFHALSSRAALGKFCQKSS